MQECMSGEPWRIGPEVSHPAPCFTEKEDQQGAEAKAFPRPDAASQLWHSEAGFSCRPMAY